MSSVSRTRRLVAVVALTLAVYLLAFWVPNAAGDDPPTTTTGDVAAFVPPGETVTPSVIVTVPARVQGHDVRWWAHRAAYWHKRTISARRTLAHRSSVTEAIELACTVYGNCETLWRRARCESHLYRYAQNASGASGLFQFLPSTWRSTPFARFSIFSPYANALAAGWMNTHGRSSEWSCR